MPTRHERLCVRGRRLETLSVAAAGFAAWGLFALAPNAGASAPAAVPAAPLTPVAPSAPPSSSASASASASGSAAVAPLKRSEPVRVALPQSGTDVKVAPPADGGGTKGALPATTDAGRATWYAAGPTPGERGAALLVGRGGKGRDAPFADLGALRPGAQVVVWREDGRPARFAVDAVEVFTSFRPDAKAARAGDPKAAELRLVATEKAAAGPYVVAFAHLLP